MAPSTTDGRTVRLVGPDCTERPGGSTERVVPARGKREAATSRAERAIRELATTGQQINFRSVARAGGVSLDFLYANADLRARIETLRKQQDTPQTDPPLTPPGPEAASAIATTLTTKLHQERAAHRSALTELEQRLAAAHGELLRLRRILDQHGIQP